jgi:hypothetical protein
MTAARKRWDDHSPRWKRDASKQGLTRARWDAWFNLSPAVRKATDIRRYAAGETVAAQRRRAVEDAVTDKMAELSAEASAKTIRLGVKEMTARQLRWTLKADPRLIRKRAVQSGNVTGTRNPWWYR